LREAARGRTLVIVSRFDEQILHAVRGRHPLIQLQTPEEDRVLTSLAPLVTRCFPGGSITTWSCVRGLEPAAEGGLDTRDPAVALHYLIARPRRGFCVMQDLSAFMHEPRVVRGLREAYFAFCREYQTALVLVSSQAQLPESLEKEVCRVQLDVPTSEDVLARMQEVERQYPSARVPAELRSQAVLALRGLTLKEIDHVLHRILSGGTAADGMLGVIYEEKAALAKQGGFLEFVPLKFDTSVVGGLENVKTWAEQRKDLFTMESIKAGLPVPKGVLIMGVSGCGKSMLAKAIAGLWQVPLFRLDMSMIFSGVYGSPEAAFHRALETIESIAPAVLWIDEMEAGLCTAKEAATPQALVFSAFLTWMQEKPPLIFVAATANRIEMLPAEIVRKGRFDQVFFCDLPSEDERAQIFEIHLKGNGADPKDFEMRSLVVSTDGWSGAEIEQAVVAARLEARQAKRKMSTSDIWRQTNSMVPLSRTMAEQVKAIREWAFKRATRASNKSALKKATVDSE
jgi:ABC-type dipeptide/oligopeptide/nickel transport system ATPase component